MSLYKIRDFDPDYRTHFEERDIIGYDLYAAEDKVGSVDDILVDERGKIRYLIVNSGVWIFGKKVLLPIGCARIDYGDRRVIAEGLSRDQVEALPEYNSETMVDYDHEERVRGVYRPLAARSSSLETSTPVESSAPLEASAPLDYERDTYNYDREPGLYGLDETRHQNLRLYEERLIANKTRAKTGEVTVGKHVETETARVSVPIEKERVVIERSTPASTTVGTPDLDSTAFREGEIARMEVYEETPEIRKEAFVREEVAVRKEVDRENVNATETLRREELDVDTQGRPIVEGGSEASRPEHRN